MTDKELLLRDLCARLPYGVICTDNRHGDSRMFNINIEDETVYYIDFDEYGSIEHCKPYLRPLSSMTEEEQLVFSSKCELTTDINGEKVWSVKVAGYDWLNAHHFDYRRTEDGKTMIEAGIALEAPEGMYETEKQEN